MKKAAKILGWVVAGYVSLALALDAFIGVTQIALEPGEREGILRTINADGTMHETRMIVIDGGLNVYLRITFLWKHMSRFDRLTHVRLQDRKAGRQDSPAACGALLRVVILPIQFSRIVSYNVSR
ncbi:MAG: hypothetical protein OXP09_20330 [Gammaproteobacteria bacterium]|nr:hypothetical protein [Gammaproteobacteria bacterium]MDE0367906.1 hypothetical protein [Gammaproteobacteria bacterium]